MNWSTRQLKEKPFHLKAKLKPSVSVSLEAATRWCWVPVPSPAAWAAHWARLHKRHSKESVMWPESYHKCWRIPKWKNFHEYSVLCSPDFRSIFCDKEMPSNSSPGSCGRQDRHPTMTGFPKSSRREWWPYCLLMIKFLPSRDHTWCSILLEGGELFRKVRFSLASLGSCLWVPLRDPFVLTGFKCLLLAPESHPKNQAWKNE